MAGLFGLFGGKSQNDDAAQPEVGNNNAPEAYYLSSDDSQSMGNSEYMRTARKTRRTFPKTLDNKTLEFEQEVASMAVRKGSKNGAAAQPVLGDIVPLKTESNGTAANGSTERRRADSSMDMFRSMAKDMRK